MQRFCRLPSIFTLVLCLPLALASAAAARGPGSQSDELFREAVRLCQEADQKASEKRLDAIHADLQVEATPPDDSAAPPQRTVPRHLMEQGGTYLAANVKDEDGTPAFIHVSEVDMPLRIAIDYPRLGARGASRVETREAAIEAMRMWEKPIQTAVPWFRLEFVKEDPDAAVQVVWKNRIPAGWAGFGRIRYWDSAEGIRVGGRMEISTTPSIATGISSRMKVEEVQLLVAHEFGHVLGLGHCLDCDSAMNYSWETRERIFVTELDVATFAKLVAIPNGTRTDGKPLRAFSGSRR